MRALVEENVDSEFEITPSLHIYLRRLLLGKAHIDQALDVLFLLILLITSV